MLRWNNKKGRLFSDAPFFFGWLGLWVIFRIKALWLVVEYELDQPSRNTLFRTVFGPRQIRPVSLDFFSMNSVCFKKRTSCLWVALVVVFAFTIPSVELRGTEPEVGHGPAAKQPNILFVFVDDLGWKDTGYMGSDFYETPHICLLYTSPSPRDS